MQFKFAKCHYWYTGDIFISVLSWKKNVRKKEGILLCVEFREKDLYFQCAVTCYKSVKFLFYFYFLCVNDPFFMNVLQK